MAPVLRRVLRIVADQKTGYGADIRGEIGGHAVFYAMSLAMCLGLHPRLPVAAALLAAVE